MVLVELVDRTDCGAMATTAKVRELTVRATPQGDGPRMLAEVVADTERRSRLDLRLQRFTRTHEVGVAAVSDWLGECPVLEDQDAYELWQGTFGRAARRVVSWQPEKRREVWERHQERKDSTGIVNNRSA